MFDRVKPPEPGAYYNIPFEDYLKWDCFSYSMVKNILKSPRHFKHAMETKTESPAMNFGKLAETIILEPERFKEEYTVLPDTCRDSKGLTRPYSTKYKDGKRIAAEIAESGKTPVKQSDCNICNGIKKDIMNHDAAKEYLEHGVHQVSLVWKDPTYGIMCKARLDTFLEWQRGIVDLKLTFDASVNGFRRTMSNFYYHLQAKHYMDGVEATISTEPHTFTFLAIESAPPFCINLFAVREDSLLTAEGMLNKAKCIYQSLLDVPMEKWEGYNMGVKDIDILPYMLNVPDDTPDEENSNDF
jgi:exodeoxyribonuclease VIII